MKLAKFLVLTLGIAFLVNWTASGQPPPGGGLKGLKGQKGAKAPTSDSEQLLVDLTLTATQRTKAREILRTHDEKMRQVMKQARLDLAVQMKEVLSEDDYKRFKDELEQVPLLPQIPPILRTIAADDLVERLMSYDKNGDGKITKDELPERMHSLIEHGDLNGDGALDRDEIKKLAERNRTNGPPGGPNGGRGGPPRGPGGGPPGRPPEERE